MLDGGHARPHRRDDSFGAVGVGSHLDAVPRGFLDHGPQLFIGVLLRAHRPFEGKHPGGSGGLDDLGAVLDLVTYRPDDFIHTVGNSLFRASLQDAGSEAARVAVAARYRETVGSRPDSGSHHEPAINGAHQGDTREAFRARIAHGGKTRQQRPARVEDALQRRVDRSFTSYAGKGVGAELAGQVDVHVDQAGQQGEVPKVDDVGIVRNFARAHRLDAAVFNDHHSVPNYSATFQVQHPCRPHNRYLLRRRRADVEPEQCQRANGTGQFPGNSHSSLLES